MANWENARYGHLKVMCNVDHETKNVIREKGTVVTLDSTRITRQ